MDQFHIAKQMLDYQRAAWHDTLSAWDLWQEQGRSLMEAAIAQAAWMPEEGRQFAAKVTEGYALGCKAFRSAVEQGFDNLVTIIDQR